MKILIVFNDTMEVLFENRLLLDMLELGLEVLQASRIAATIGATASTSDIEAFVLDFFAINSPACIVSLGRMCNLIPGFTNQPPLPAPFFLVFLGSTST
jgi:hypothetical protein